MDIASRIVKMMPEVNDDKLEHGDNPMHVHAHAMLSAIRTGNAEGLSKALENHYQMYNDQILNASAQSSAGDEANKVSTE